jgi:dTDP-4-amino-4,6-dideoxygalactose transaminase
VSARPAALGGDPAFDPTLPVFRPTLPDYSLLEDDVKECFRTGMLTAGPRALEFEKRLADHLGVAHAVCVSSCTTGLILAYQALGLKGEVIVPSFTFMATVHPLAWNGVTPVFADVDPETWNLDPVQVEKLITSETTGIVGVHLLGTPAAVRDLQDIADRHSLKLAFDGAHGFGALHQGRPLGGHGNVEVFSATPTKVLNAVEGGVVTTNDDALAEHVRVARNYGNPGDYGSDFPGLNARMPEFNAILGMRSLDMLEANVGRRQEIAAVFYERLGPLGITFQRIEEGDRSSYKEFSMLVNEAEFGLSRDGLARALKEDGIDSRFYYDPPVHDHKAYRHLETRGDMAVTRELCATTITIPIHSHMDDRTVDTLCNAIERIKEHAEEIRAKYSVSAA